MGHGALFLSDRRGPAPTPRRAAGARNEPLRLLPAMVLRVTVRVVLTGPFSDGRLRFGL